MANPVANRVTHPKPELSARSERKKQKGRREKNTAASGVRVKRSYAR
jgi:hypothetical protein